MRCDLGHSEKNMSEYSETLSANIHSRYIFLLTTSHFECFGFEDNFISYNR